MNENILGRVRTILCSALNVDEDDVTKDAMLVADLGAESIDFLDIQFRIEREFSLRLHQEEVANATNWQNMTVGDLTNFVQERSNHEKNF
jgi:acyl carrier protein